MQSTDFASIDIRQIAAHEVRLDSIEERQQKTDSKLDSIHNWIMGTLVSALGGTIAIIVTILLSKK